MFKKTLILLLSSFFTIAGTPDFLLASDNVELADLDNSKMVQTVIVEPEPEPEPEPVVEYAPVYYAPANRLEIAGRTLAVEYTDDTSVDAGGVVKFYNNRFLYGHNSPYVFGFLSSVGVGQTFSITFNGVTTNYRVSNRVEYKKNSLTTLGLGTKNYKMSHVANGYDPNENQHSLIIMTCSGTPIGHSDATHRLVLFADAI